MTPQPSHTIIKVMSISRAEFVRSLAVLDPAAVWDANAAARVHADGIAAHIQFEALAQRTLGRLLAMPQARVTITIETACARRRAAFLTRFDIAFQRGGG